MIINKNLDGTELTLALEGRIDTTTAPMLEDEIGQMPEEVTSIVLDFEKVEYISSAGLRVILATQKTMQKKGGMVIKNVNETVMEIFEITGFVDILTIQ